MKTRLLVQFNLIKSCNWLLYPFKSLMLLFLFSALIFSSKTLGQSPCGNINCTSNDVQVVSAYISAPGDMPIDCNSSDPFDNAELHLIISSNTQRVGISISTILNTTDNLNNITGSYPVGTCFSGVELNNGSNNNLVYHLGSTLSGVQCGPGFSLSNVFISWGTGNTDFCDASYNPHCPETPAKCRFKPGEIIPVEVKLEVDFSWTTGVCADGGNSLTLDFTPSVITQQNLTFPLTFDWDFGDGNTAQTTAASLSNADLASAGVSHTYASAGTYNVKLTGSDASPFFSKTAIHAITLIACCNVAAPVLSVENNCGTSTITAKDADGNAIPADELTWSNGATGNPITVAATDAVTATVTVGDCTSDASNSVTPAPKTIPSAPVLSVVDNCDGTSTITAKDADGNLISADELTWSNEATGNPISVTTTTAITATITVGDCTSDASNSVTPAPKTSPTVTATDNSVCAGSSVTLTGTPDGGTWSGDHVTGSTFDATGLSAGPYTVNYNYTNAAGCKGSDDATITVNALPIVSAGSYGPFCINASAVTLTGTPSGGTWSGDGVTLVSGTYKFTPSNAGTGAHILTYMYTDGNTCSNSATTSVAVNPQPLCTITNVTSGSSHSAGVGQAVKFSGPSASGYAYAWSFTSNTAGASFAGGIANTQSITVTTTTTGSYTLSLKVTDNNYTTQCNSTCTYSVTINTSNAYYSVTQGFYGNVGGKICTPSGSLFTAGTKSTVDGLIAVSIKNMPGQKLLLGITGNNRTFSMTATATEEKNLITYMPAGQAASIITPNAGSNNNTNITTNLPKLYNKKISDVLLGQAITLDLNVYIPQNTLGSLVLKTGYLTTQKADVTSCPVKKVVSCSSDASAINSLQITTNTALMTYLNGKTVNDLLALASNVLGGGSLPAGVTLSDINNAVDVINQSFDGGRFFLGYYSSKQTCSTISSAVASVSTSKPLNISQLTVKAYPNPYNNTINFHFASPVSGKATLMAYDLTGKKLAIIFEGNVNSGSEYDVKYNVSAGNKVPIMYKLTIGNYTYHGMLIPEK